MVKNSPSAMSRSSRSIATTSPYVRRMPLSRTAGLAASRSSAALAGACVAKGFLQDPETALQLLVRGRERREQADHVAVEAAREQHEPLLPRCRRDRFGGVAALLCQLEREHRAEAAHLADDRMPRRDLVEPRAEEARDLLRAFAEP